MSCGKQKSCGGSGCNKLNVFDWLEGIELPYGHSPYPIVEIGFKGSRKEYYINSGIELNKGDWVVVDAENGYDLGYVTLKGELVKLQLKKNDLLQQEDSFRKIIRIAGENDLEKYKLVKSEEVRVLQRARTIALEIGLSMKLSDIEFRGDRKRVTFFYTAEERVDFRELLKRYADEFKTRIIMRHISYRQEASRLGAIGSCGRELCCSTWFTNFKIVSMGAARYQNVSLNPLKLQGQCGKLKCCLNFELDSYLEALSEFPKDHEKLRIQTQAGSARALKTDILKRIIWFVYEGRVSDWIPIRVEDVFKLIELNKTGVIPETLGQNDRGTEPERIKTATEEFEGSLTRMEDKTKKAKKHKSSRNRNKNKNKDS